MIKLHLNYDGNQSNGIIANELYPQGVIFKGSDLKPKLSFTYDSFQYSDMYQNTNNYVVLDGLHRAMTHDEIDEVKLVALNWIQLAEQEGGTVYVEKQTRYREVVTTMIEVCVTALHNSNYSHTDINCLFPNYKGAIDGYNTIN